MNNIDKINNMHNIYIDIGTHPHLAIRHWNHDISCVESGVVWAWYCYKQRRLHFALWPVFWLLALGSPHLLVAQNQYDIILLYIRGFTWFNQAKCPPLWVLYTCKSPPSLPFSLCTHVPNAPLLVVAAPWRVRWNGSRPHFQDGSQVPA